MVVKIVLVRSGRKGQELHYKTRRHRRMLGHVALHMMDIPQRFKAFFTSFISPSFTRSREEEGLIKEGQAEIPRGFRFGRQIKSNGFVTSTWSQWIITFWTKQRSTIWSIVSSLTRTKGLVVAFPVLVSQGDRLEGRPLLIGLIDCHTLSVAITVCRSASRLLTGCACESRETSTISRGSIAYSVI